MNDSDAVRSDIVVIGASAGGLPVLLTMAAGLRAGFPAIVLIVQHIGAHPSELPQLLSRAGPNRAVHARDGALLERGLLYVAPPDCHLVVADGRVRLVHAAKENHSRPAIDPLFRSAAIAYGPRVVGVVLSGRLDDGTSGLQWIKTCGGDTVVQDPDDAEERGMPESAMANVTVDHVTTRQSLAALLTRLVARPREARAAIAPPRRLLQEHQLTLKEGNAMPNLDEIGTPSRITCPDCHGVLWELTGTRPRRYRCHTGHAYTAGSLAAVQAMRTEDAIFGALRALHEREALLLSMAAERREAGDTQEAERLSANADDAAVHSRHFERMLKAG